MNFNNFSCLIFELKCTNTHKPKNTKEGKNVLIPPYCILLSCILFIKKYKSLKPYLFDIHHILHISQCALSRNILLEAVLQANPLKSPHAISS